MEERKPRSLRVKLGDKEYQISTTENEDLITAAAAMVNDQFHGVSTQLQLHHALLAALKIAADLTKIQKEQSLTDDRISGLLDSIAQSEAQSLDSL